MTAAPPTVSARPGRHVASSVDAAESEHVVWRFRLLAVCVGLAAVAFRQQPGLVVADTKLDLTVDPWGFLGRALHLWDPQGAFGQLQNQAYGYLFPMGPFHGVLHSLGVPPWVAQRLWWTLLLCVAFLGVWRVATELRVGTPWLRLVGAVAYALSPRIASELTITSVEVWPMAVAPWVLLPLVVRADRTWRWRVTRSALAFACCGGVNAVASGAALVLPTVWFLTRRPARRTVVAFVGWLVAVLVAMAWWLLPLAVLGRYSPPFLDWIEGAAVTTSTASPFETLRGTSAWLSFLTSASGPEWPGGWSYVTQPGVVVATTLVSAFGLAGLVLRRLTERVFLAVGVVVGLVLLGLGHTGALGSPLAGPVQELLDGPLAALRNTHKFDPVVRLPLALAAVAALDAVVDRLRTLEAPRWVAPAMVVSLVAMATAPSVVAGLAREEAYRAIPGYWQQAATWLDRQPEAGTVLVLPAASFADLSWGSTKDDPLQSLMKRPFAVRDAVPLGSAGATRWLDGVERAVGSGRGDASVRAALAAAGVRYVLVRNDLRLDAQGDPLLPVHAALEQSQLDRVASFGPDVGSTGEPAGETVDYRTRLDRPALEVFRVPDATQATVQPLDSLPRALAGPEDATALAGRVAPRALLGTDGATTGGAPAAVLTDGLRRREVNFGEPTRNTSAVLGEQEPVRQDRPVTDFDADPGAPRTTTAWTGIAGVRASSSASDATASLRLGPSASPAAAVDGDPTTRWVSGRFGQAVGEWLQVDLPAPRQVDGVTVDVSVEAPVVARPEQVVVSTERGSRTVQVGDTGGQVYVGLPSGTTRWVRVTLDSVRQGAVNGFALDEVTLSGTVPQQYLRVPDAQDPATIVLRRDDGSRSGCASVATRTYCAPGLAVPGEGPTTLARRVVLGDSGRYTLSGTVRPVASSTTDALFDFGNRVRATSSSRLVPDPRDRPGAALDGDLGTGWVAGTADFDPTFTIRLPETRELSGVQFLADPALAASGPRAVTVSFGGDDEVTGEVDEDGYLRFPARRARTVTMTFGATRPLVDVDSRTAARTFVPVGFSEVRLLGADDLRQPLRTDVATSVPCGFGPTLEVNGRRLETRVDGTLADLTRGRALRWTACGDDEVELDAGTNDLRGLPSGEFTPDTITLTRAGADRPSAGAAQALAVERPGPERLRAQVPPRSSASVVTVAQNFSAGWVAEVDGRSLEAVRVNGWMQGWVVPPGAATMVSAHFAPDRSYRLGMLLGAILLAGLVAVALVPGRRSRGEASATAPSAGAGTGAHRAPTTGPVVLPRWGGPVLAVVAGAVLGGVVGAVLGLLAAALSVLSPRLRRTTWLAGALVVGPLVAAGLVALDPWPGGRANLDSGVVQALSLAAALLAVACALSVTRSSHRHRRTPGERQARG